MSYPIKELITRDVEDTLKGIQSAAGFAYDLNVKRYVGAQKYVPEHLVCVVYQDGEERIEQEVFNKDGRELRIAVDCFIMPPPTDPTPIDTIANIIEADMTKALLATFDRGGKAIDTHVEPADPFTEFGEADGFTLLIRVHYRTTYGDGYELAT